MQTEHKLSVDKSVDILCEKDHDLLNSFEYEDECKKVSVKGRLKSHLQFWKDIGANSYILSVIDKGYVIPFITTPSSACLRNNKSARDNADFVEEAISELLRSNSVIEVNEMPIVVNPLTVAINAKGKKRLVLDLRHVNLHIWKEKIKFDDWRVAIDYIDFGSYMYSFDFSSGYHHIDIHESCQDYLGFSWKFGDKVRFFKFTVLPFGLSSAGHIFTKTVRCLVNHWRGKGIKIIIYLDDGFGAEKDLYTALLHSKIVHKDVVDSGFVPNEDKSIWDPVRDLIFLGIGVNTVSNTLYVPSHKIDAIMQLAYKAIMARKCTARRLASLAGKIISIRLVAGNVTLMMTKYIHLAVCTRSTWDSYFTLSDNVLEELQFWLREVSNYKIRSLKEHKQFTKIVFSDASATGCGGYTVNVHNSVVHRSWSSDDMLKSSAWRELMGVDTVLKSSIHHLKGQSIKWYSDNKAVVSILEKGSMKPDLQCIALDIFKFCKSNDISIDVEWIPRSLNDKADYISKIIDYDDWGVSKSFFDYLNRKWGVHTFDRFANLQNKKVARFNSKFWTPGSLGVDAFAFDWGSDVNWIVPPICLVSRAIKHLRVCKGRATLVVPLWRSAAFWPLLIRRDGSFNDFIKDYEIFEDVTGIFVQGCVKTIFDDNFASPVIAFKIVM